MQKTLPRILLLILVLLTGCIGGFQYKIYKISGVIYHQDSEIPVVNAEITIIAGNKSFPLSSDLEGRFSITLRTNITKLKLTVQHPSYHPWQRAINLGKDREHSLLIELTSMVEDHSLVAGRIDYALPEITAAGLQAYSDGLLEPVLTETWQEEPAEIIVEPYKYNEAVALEIGRALGSDIFQLYPESGIIVYIKPEHLTVDAFLSLARTHPLVKAADINYPVYPLATAVSLEQLILTPNDPEYDQQWNLTAVYLPFAWPQAKNKTTVRIAVLDSLIATEHPDLQQNLHLQDAYNVLKQSQDVSDYHGRTSLIPSSHGTHVTGIIGATTNNARGIAGISWGANVEIIPIVVLDENNRSSLSNVIAGIDKAIELDVDIINMSLGANLNRPYDHLLYNKIREADAAGIIMIAAAGNDNQLLYPAGYPEVIAVGATTREYQIADYSAADGVTLFAPGGARADPGGGIYSTDLVEPSGDGYSAGRGTSMAAPHVAGIAALVKGTYPNIIKSEIEQLLWNTGIVFDLEQPQQRLVNAYAAVTKTPINMAVLCFSSLDTMADYEVEFDQNRYFHLFLPPGSYLVTAHIDANQDQEVNPGEWYYQSEILVEPGKHVSDLEIRLDIYR